MISLGCGWRGASPAVIFVRTVLRVDMPKFMNVVRKYGPKLALVPASVVPMLSHAAVDVTSITSGITDAGTAILAVITALIALSASIFGIVKAYGFIKRRAGA